MLEKILVPVDGSKRAEAVFGQLRLLLHRPETEAIVLRAAYVPGSLRGADHTVLLEERAAEAWEYVENLACRLRQSGIRARGMVRQQYPAGGILDAAAEEGAGLVAMSSHGSTGVHQWIFGSVAQKVLLASHVPVLVMRSFEDPSGRGSAPIGSGEFRPRKILVPTDGSRFSLAVVPVVAELARRFGAEIVTLHVRELAPKHAGIPAEADGDRRPAWGEEEALHPGSDPAVAACDCFVPVRLSAVPRRAEGDPASKILDVSRSEGAGLIAMATHGSDRGIAWSLGSVTQKVLCSSPLPMLVIRPFQQAAL